MSPSIRLPTCGRVLLSSRAGLWPRLARAGSGWCDFSLCPPPAGALRLCWLPLGPCRHHDVLMLNWSSSRSCKAGDFAEGVAAAPPLCQAQEAVWWADACGQNASCKRRCSCIEFPLPQARLRTPDVTRRPASLPAPPLRRRCLGLRSAHSAAAAGAVTQMRGSPVPAQQGAGCHASGATCRAAAAG